MSLNVGRIGRLYVVKEAGTLGGNGAGYGQVQNGASTSNTLSAGARAIRHTDFKFMYDPFNRVHTVEKKTSPGRVNMFDRRPTAALSALSCLVRPSGTLNTTPEADPVYEAAFGQKTNVILATTLNDAAATTTSAILTSVVGLAKWGVILLTVAGKKYARFITNIAGSTVTWAPALPAAPANASAVKSGLVYQLTSANAISLAFLHVLSGYRRECRGVGIDKWTLSLDGNTEPQFTASGPAQKQVNDASALADPTTFTTLGNNPPSGIIGETYIGASSYLMRKASADISNALKLRNEEYGANSDTGEASEVYREGRRDVGITLDAFVETAATLHDLSIAGTTASFFNQTGRTEGNIIAVYAPSVYWHPPDTTSPEGPSDWNFKGTALESADGQNDELFFALL